MHCGQVFGEVFSEIYPFPIPYTYLREQRFQHGPHHVQLYLCAGHSQSLRARTEVRMSGRNLIAA